MLDSMLIEARATMSPIRWSGNASGSRGSDELKTIMKHLESRSAFWPKNSKL